MNKKKQRIITRITNFVQEIWFKINQFLKENGREIISKKIIDNLLYYFINFLLITTISYAFYQLFSDIKAHFLEIPSDKKFPFILDFSEHLFLYFLPIFILFGLLKYYELEWRRGIINTNPPTENKNYLDVSKKLFFSSLLSYTSLKIIEKLFFDYDNFNNLQMFYIVIFFIALIIFVLVQHSHE